MFDSSGCDAKEVPVSAVPATPRAAGVVRSTPAGFASSAPASSGPDARLTDADRFIDALARPQAAVPNPRRAGEEPASEPSTTSSRQAATSEPLSAAVRQLLEVVQAVVAQVPAELPGAQALADTRALLGGIEQLRAAVLGRVADVDARKLHLLDGAPTAGTWLAQQQTSLDRGEVALARRLGGLPRLDEAVRRGTLSVAVAERVGKVLAKLRRHVDRPDGLIDGQDAEQALLGAIGHGVPMIVFQALGGLDETDPRVSSLLEQVAAIAACPSAQLDRLEAAFVLVASWIEPALLPGALGMLVDALLPNELEKRGADGHANRGFGIRRKEDGSGYWVTDGDLDLECGALLEAFLAAEEAVDPDNPHDTAGYEQLRAQGWQAGDPLPDITGAIRDSGAGSDVDGGGAQRGDAGTDGGEEPAASCGPRSRRQRAHDALKNGLRRYLDSNIAGMRDKVAPHLNVIVPLSALHQMPGALPAVTSTGTRLPASLVRRWLCDSALTRFVLGLGGKVIETSHTERTLKPHERRAKRVETGGICQSAGCHPPPGGPLIPHHPDAWARCGTTSYDDTVMFCRHCHHDIHDGGKTIRLKDGRWLNADGWVRPP